MKVCRRRRCRPPCCGAAIVVQQIPHGTPAPDGWVFVEGAERTDHHRTWSTLAMRVEAPAGA